MPADPPEPTRALLGLCSLLGRRRLGQTRQADIAAATGIGVTRLQRLAGTWRPDRDCPPADVVEVRALARFAAGVLGVEERAIGRWLAGLADGRETESVVSAIRRIVVAAVERRIELADVELPPALAALLYRRSLPLEVPLNDQGTHMTRLIRSRSSHDVVLSQFVDGKEERINLAPPLNHIALKTTQIVNGQYGQPDEFVTEDGTRGLIPPALADDVAKILRLRETAEVLFE